MSGRPDWDSDGKDWPNKAASRFVSAGGLRWHVQVAGHGPVVLLLHGTGAATHSWRDLVPRLAPHATVVAPDLPGHGFTGAPPRSAGFSLPGVAAGVAALLRELGLRPVLVAGHSAGAAIAIRLCLDGAIDPVAVISLNGALLPFPGMSNALFGAPARFLASSRLAAEAVTFLAGSRLTVDRLLTSTGSRIDPDGARLYARLIARAGHVHGAMALMAHWDLEPLLAALPALKPHLVLVTGTRDGMVPPHQAHRVRTIRPEAEIVSLRGLGHLAHEERPDDIARLILERLPPCPS
jgi:magnesium chelatase accessory protein